MLFKYCSILIPYTDAVSVYKTPMRLHRVPRKPLRNGTSSVSVQDSREFRNACAGHVRHFLHSPLSGGGVPVVDPPEPVGSSWAPPGKSGTATADVCRKHGISNATFYKWKAKYGGQAHQDRNGAVRCATRRAPRPAPLLHQAP